MDYRGTKECTNNIPIFPVMGSIGSDAPEGEGFPDACSFSAGDSSSKFSGEGEASSPHVASPVKGGDLDSLEMDSLEKIILHWEADNLHFEKKVVALKRIVSLKNVNTTLRAEALNARSQELPRIALTMKHASAVASSVTFSVTA